MDRITPIELDRTQFPKRFRGYDPKAVQVSLQRAAREIEWLLTQLDESRRENERLNHQLETYRSQDNALREALVLAQKTADETRVQAHREAASILEEAERKAEEARKGIAVGIRQERWELERLRMERESFRRRFEALLKEHLHNLDHPSPQLALIETEDADSTPSPARHAKG